MKKKLNLSLLKKLFLISFVLLMSSACAVKEQIYHVAPTLLPSTERKMKTPGFWISGHPFPDKTILIPKEIEGLNSHIKHKLRLVKDIPGIKSLYSGKKLISNFKKNFNYFYKNKLYQKDGSIADNGFFIKIKNNINIDQIPPQIELQFGFIVHSTQQRYFPAEEGLYSKVDFDKLQTSVLDIGTPLAVLHKSLDGKWYYVISSLTSGWVKADKVALCERREMEDILKKEDFVVVTKAKGDIFLNPSLTEYYDYARMGVSLPLYRKTNSEVIEVIIPFSQQDGTLSPRIGYMKKKDVNHGYLPYTSRNVIQQAFELLNEPYGWAGMYGEQDCSRFIQQIFATIGIFLPRNSSSQARAGFLIKKFDKKSTEEEKLHLLFSRAIGGITLLQWKGHIMLFLGTVNDRPYIIHAMWSYQEKLGSKDVTRVVNRVAVTDLSLGRDSKKTSFLERLKRITLISKRNISIGKKIN